MSFKQQLTHFQIKQTGVKNKDNIGFTSRELGGGGGGGVISTYHQNPRTKLNLVYIIK